MPFICSFKKGCGCHLLWYIATILLHRVSESLEDEGYLSVSIVLILKSGTFYYQIMFSFTKADLSLSALAVHTKAPYRLWKCQRITLKHIGKVSPNICALSTVWGMAGLYLPPGCPPGMAGGAAECQWESRGGQSQLSVSFKATATSTLGTVSKDYFLHPKKGFLGICMLNSLCYPQVVAIQSITLERNWPQGLEMSICDRNWFSIWAILLTIPRNTVDNKKLITWLI